MPLRTETLATPIEITKDTVPITRVAIEEREQEDGTVEVMLLVDREVPEQDGTTRTESRRVLLSDLPPGVQTALSTLIDTVVTQTSR